MAIEVWIIGEDRKMMIENQRQVNRHGSMRAVCLLSDKALREAIRKVREFPDTVNAPSLIVMDYDFAKKNDFQHIHLLRDYDKLAGIPLFMAVKERSEELNEECYENGAMVIVHDIFHKSELTRMENTAWQHENTRLYEQKLQKQTMELHNAKEIFRLNQQLEARNELLHKTFGRYFSDDLLNLILQKGEDVSLGGEKAEATIMMTDLRNFTSLSENMDSDVLTSVLNFYFTKMVDIVSHYRGTVIEYMGDGMLAVFGAPLKDEHSVDNAVAAAIAMQNAMPSLNEYFVENGFPSLEMGIGLHCGEVFIGNIGSEKMMRYNVIGNTVNESSRIESCSVGGQILVSKEIILHCVNPLVHKEGVEITAKGMKAPIWIFEVTGIGGDYNLSMENNKNGAEEFKKVTKDINLHLYPIKGKLITDEFVNAKLKEISQKRIIIEIEENESVGIDVYTNVKITSPIDNEEMSGGFYSKIIARKGNLWTLHYTDAGNVVGDFIKFVLEDEVWNERAEDG